MIPEQSRKEKGATMSDRKIPFGLMNATVVWCAVLLGAHATGVAQISTSATPRTLDEISPKQFETLFRIIKPKPGESLWAEIPWMRNLTEARKKAAAEGKPVAVWTMSGEPTGMC